MAAPNIDWDQIFSSAAGLPYNRNWPEAHNVDRAVCTSVPTSKHKLDYLHRHGAVVPGDQLRLSYQMPGQGTVYKTATVMDESTASEMQILIATNPTPGKQGISRGAQGPKDIIEAMNNYYDPVHAEGKGWKGVSLVSSTGVDLGTLHDVRQAFDMWMREKKAWQDRASNAAGNT